VPRVSPLKHPEVKPEYPNINPFGKKKNEGPQVQVVHNNSKDKPIF
jgi:hypothetical protein